MKEIDINDIEIGERDFTLLHPFPNEIQSSSSKIMYYSSTDLFKLKKGKKAGNENSFKLYPIKIMF